MSDLLTLYGQKISATYAANQAFFRKHLAGFLNMLEQEAAGVTIQAHVDEDGRIDLSLDGHPLPLQELLDQSRETLRMFDADERPCIVVRPHTGLPDGTPQADDHVRRYFISDLDYRNINALDAAFARHCKPGEALDHPSFGRQGIPILIIFGSGYGSHIIELLDRFDIRHLIIVDNDPSISRLSMGFTDYIAIYNNHLLRGVKFSMVCNTNPEVLVDMLATSIQAGWPPYMVHGVAVFRNLRNIALCEKVEEGLSDKLWLAYRGWGFYDDELLSIRHTIANLAAGRPVCRVTQPVDDNAVAIVVGNGPSLDGLSELIRRHKDKAIIISCGTAISTLYKLGIQPDIHVEIERTYSTVESIKYVVPEEFRAGIIAVCSNPLHPEVFDGFAEGMMFLKGGDTSAVSFPSGYLSVNTFPTVANGAVSWLLGLGFKTLYLAGIDLGAKDAERHHAKGSLYYETDAIPAQYAEQVQKGDTIRMTMETDANFGDGKIRTNDILTLGRMSMENVISNYSAAKVYNLSDGALIKGSTPLPPEDFALPESLPGKQETIAQIRANFEHPEGFGPVECRDRVLDHVKGIVDAIRPLVDKPAESKMELTDKMAGIYATALKMSESHESAWWILRGSMLHLQRRVYECMSYIPTEEAAVAYGKEAHDIFGRFLDEAVQVIADIDPAAPVPEVGAQRLLREIRQQSPQAV